MPGGGELPAQQQVLAVRLPQGLAQGHGLPAVAASEAGELGGQRPDHAAGLVRAGTADRDSVVRGRPGVALPPDPGADRGSSPPDATRTSTPPAPPTARC